MVIVDLNIWERIQDNAGRFNDDVVLCSTYLNFYELAKTTRLKSQPLVVKNIFKKIYKYRKDAIPKNPLDYLASFENPGLNESNIKEKELILEVENFISTPDAKILYNSAYNQDFNNSLKSIYSVYDNLVEIINSDILLQIRNNIKETSNKKEHRSQDTSKHIVKMFEMLVKTSTGYSISENFPWEKFKVLTDVTEHFFKDLELQKGSKITPNDLLDLLYFTYVNGFNRAKFWTNDKYWNGLLIKTGHGERVF